MVNSSSICYHLSVLLFFKCKLYHYFRLSSSLLCSANLKLSKPTCNTKKVKPRCLVYFSLSEHDRWKIEGEGKHSRQRRQLSNLGEQTATNLCFTGLQWCTVGRQDGTLLRFRRRERANGRKWQQMKLAGCGVLFSPACSNEQAFRTDWRNWSPVDPEPSLFHLSGAFTKCGKQLETHT